ncbi:helicase C-terminal domain-containing protein [Nocardioides perillae]|uniref:Helicase XPB/Ssl2 N-terminal domain-containing protein n=1 Tax=Nocardioides perillae TaxID=1119534 RepID=A0A7Y9RUK1_9ACTN|nr:helicase C-terminal domain-containing protein [Nocardioides perillae]NYG54878.1 hypothetical protein [Nocardioides perillae]
MSTATPARSLADQLRRWPDERLARLLRARPDLATPAPHDSTQLASRASTRSSLTRALDLLTAAELHVLDALVLQGETTLQRLVATVHASPASVGAAVERLVDLALAWEASGGLRPLSGVAEQLATGGSGAGGGTGPSGLHPWTPDAPDEAVVAARVAELSPAARALLEHVEAHGGTGTTGTTRRTVSAADARTPAEELVARRLLVPREDELLVLPGEVGTHLRGGRTTREPVDAVPEVATTERDPALVDRTAAGAAFEAVRRTELLLDAWGTAPPAALRNGGLAVRDLKAVAVLLDVDEATAALHVELAQAAGLLATAADDDGDPAWTPTDLVDTWVARPVAERWAELAVAWLRTSRVPGLVGTKDSAGKTWNALAPELASSIAAESRAAALAELAALPPGATLATGTGLPSLLERLRWRRPRRPRVREQMTQWAVTEATTLGLLGLGGVPAAARPLLGDPGEPSATGPTAAADDPAAARDAAEALAPLLPAPVDHVLLQADLTAVAPGPLESQLARRLQVLADVESRGGATTYRFHTGSVRRAFDAGWSAAEVHAFLDEVSRTPVPQPLAYLVDDTARTFGTVRVGHAEAFLRADDETALAALLHDPRAAALGLRRIAPTVLVSETPVDLLLPRLRELGAAPVVEAADGTVHVARPDVRRARTPKDRRPPGLRAAREGAHLTTTVTAIRAGDRAAAARPDRPPAPTTPVGTMAALREAIEARVPVWIGYVDNHGTSTERIVEPRRLEGGSLTALDQRSDDVRSFAVHRITAVRPVPPGP